MKNKRLFLVVLLSTALAGYAQTLYVPSGTGGIGTSGNANLGIGISNPETTLDINGSVMLRGWDAVLSSKNGDGNLFQLIGTYQGWNNNAIYIAGYNAANNGSVASKSVSFGGAGCERLWIDLMAGNVGIGTTTPQAKLDVRGDMYINSGIDDNHIYWGSHNLTMGTHVGDYAHNVFSIKPGGASQGSLVSIFQMFNAVSETQHDLKVVIHTDGNSYFNGGNVGIGTTSPDEKLTVNGIVHAKEVRVDLTGALADYVFSKDYSLMPLHKVEQYVKTNSHLPDIPSADEVKQQGLGMGEMQNKLLQKIEELTLYVIQQQKEIQALKERIGTSPNPSEGGE